MKTVDPELHTTLTNRQKKIWSSGDFNEIARQNRGLAEAFISEVDPHPGQTILDVACGSGTAALIAERRYCEVTGIDYVPHLVERARKIAVATGQKARFDVGDAQNLPYPDNSFDLVLSVYGVQFAPNQHRAAQEMLRVCKPGGRIALAGPIPAGWSGDFFAAHARFNPPPPEAPSPLRWGTEEGIRELLDPGCSSVENSVRTTLQYFLSVDHAVEVFTRWFGPAIRVLDAVDQEKQEEFLDELRTIFSRYNRADGGMAIVENQYLRTIAVCK